MRRSLTLLSGLAAAICSYPFVGLPAASASEPAYNPPIAPASNEGELSLKGFQIPKEMTGSLWAAEPLLANPVAIAIDEQGRLFVAETFRQEKGVEDNRSHMNWLNDDLSLQTVEDRAAMFRKHLGDKADGYGKEHDRIRRLVDTDGNGQADQSTVYADGFNDILDGTGAGLLARRGIVYFTCIPKLWMLKDTNNDGVAEEKIPLHHGYGVRVAFRGHDLHGLTLGPDGRIYFSIGDRGYNIDFEGKKLVRPDTGAVFRCEPDGSHLEVFAHGLRNPQELAFDDHGNLFTCDNNSDGGDKARWTYIVEGGDIGWRMYYQYLSDRGPWNRERIWHPYKEDHVAYTVPAIANFSDGPSGLAYYPGVGLPDRYQGHFFLVDFRGQPGNSGVRSFGLKPKGATFEMTDAHEFLWHILATDVEFGYDGGLYLSDWVNGWSGLGKGRIYRFEATEAAKNPSIAEAATLMREGFRQRNADELGRLLSHADRRVRLEAQIAMAENGFEEELVHLTAAPASDIVRRHAIWGLGQRTRGGSAPAQKQLTSLLKDADPEIRAQAARVLGDSARQPAANAASDLTTLLRDESLRVRSLAALAVGQLVERGLLDGGSFLDPLCEVLRENANRDPIVRHAATLALARSAKAAELAELARHPVAAVRLGGVVALRRQKSAELARFLNDVDPQVLVEAARAIYDEGIRDAWPALATLASRPTSSLPKDLQDGLVRRTLAANFQLGTAEAAERIARLAADPDLPANLRQEAIEELKLWPNEVLLDRVTGEHRPRPKHNGDDVAAALKPVLGGLFTGGDAIRKASASLAAQYGIKEVEPVLAEILADASHSAEARAAALQAISDLKSPKAGELASAFLADPEKLVRIQARRAVVRVRPEEAVPLLSKALDSGDATEKQAAIADLAARKSKEADDVLKSWLARLAKGDVEPAIQLDLLEAGRTRPDLKSVVEAWEKTLPADDEVARYRVALLGGNAERGRELFFGRGDLSCRRCHSAGGEGGAVGPELTKISQDKPREYLLESIVLPNKAIAKGFESLIVITTSGQSYSGIVKESTDKELKLMLADGSVVTIAKDEIEETAKGISGMPGDIVKKMSLVDLRDLVEYLSTLK